MTGAPSRPVSSDICVGPFESADAVRAGPRTPGHSRGHSMRRRPAHEAHGERQHSARDLQTHTKLLLAPCSCCCCCCCSYRPLVAREGKRKGGGRRGVTDADGRQLRLGQRELTFALAQ